MKSVLARVIGFIVFVSLLSGVLGAFAMRTESLERKVKLQDEQIRYYQDELRKRSYPR